jgi:hypothetical protein
MPIAKFPALPTGALDSFKWSEHFRNVFAEERAAACGTEQDKFTNNLTMTLTTGTRAGYFIK